MALLVLLAAGLPVPGLEAAPSDEAVRWIIGVDPFPDVARGDRWNGADVVRADPDNGFLVALGGDSFRQKTATRSDVTYIERDRPVDPLYTPNDPLYSSQYGPDRVRANDAWNTITGGTDIVLCVIDTALRTTHEDIAGPRWRGGRDVADNDNDVNGPDNHGTHVTGIAAATMDNSRGIAGIAQVPFKFVKVMESATGVIWSSDLATGIRWCADNDTDVISMSLGNTDAVLTVGNAVRYAAGQGLLQVAATGNDGCDDCVIYPAAFPEVIAVGCTHSANNLCDFSNRGPEVELTAPGTNIQSTCFDSDSAYCRASGTSMSTPHVAGVAALVWSSNPMLDASELRTILQQSALDRGPGGRDPSYGFGIVDAEAARQLAYPSPPVASFTVTCSGHICYFDGTGSYDTGGGIATYRWVFGNGHIWTTDRADVWKEYSFSTPNTLTASLTVTDTDGYTDSTTRTVQLSWENDPGWQLETPADPHLPDRHYDYVSDKTPLDADLEVSWFESDPQRLYIGARIDGGSLATEQMSYRWAFTPGWDPIDATFDRRVPAGEDVVRFEIRAGNMRVAADPNPEPNLNGRMDVDLWGLSRNPSTGQETWHHLADLPITGVIQSYLWISVERAYLGIPPSGVDLRAPEAVAIRSARGIADVDTPSCSLNEDFPIPWDVGCLYVDHSGVGADHRLR